MIKRAGNNTRRIRRYSITLLILAGIILIPVGIVLSSLLMKQSEIWNHLKQNLLLSYVAQTLGLALGTLFFSVLIGVSAAWTVVYYDFPLKRLLSPLLAIPMALPAYISAFTYAGILDYTGPLQLFIRNVLKRTQGYLVPDIMNLPGAVFIMTMALYPYVYLTVRGSFRQQAGSVYEAAGILGVKGLPLFFRVSLPLVRPALIGGSILVLMETLNEYGAVHYFGVNTLTVGIFRTWFALGDLQAAMKLASYLLLGVFLIILSERKLRGRKGYSLPSPKPFRPVRISGWRAALAVIICTCPVLLGFLIPVLQLLSWTKQSSQSPFSLFYLKLFANSLSLAGTATVIILSAAISAAHILRNRRLRQRKLLSSVMTLGYAIPGAVIALGIMVFFGSLDRSLNNMLSLISENPGRLFLSGTFAALIVAYGIRYLGVAFGPIDSGFNQASARIHEAARTLGFSGIKTLILIDLPNIPSSLKAAFILVFIDIMKELPLTMILRPFNFDTLAVRAYEMAGDEQLTMAALPSLVIVAIGLLPVFLLMNRSHASRRS